MKRKTTYPDGRVEEMEGTPEEFRVLDGRDPQWRFVPAPVAPIYVPTIFPVQPQPFYPWNPGDVWITQGTTSGTTFTLTEAPSS